MNWLDGLALAAQGGAQGSGSEGSGGPGLGIMIAIILVIFYFLILRPQKKEQSQVQSMRDQLKKGDKVKSIGGIHGVIVAVFDATVRVKVDRNTELEFDKQAIASVVKEPEKEEATAKTA